MSELLVLWTESYGLSLKLANSFAHADGEVLDCSVIGRWSQLLINTEKVSNIQSLLLEVPSDLEVQKKVIKNIHPEVINSFLSLSTQKIEDFVLTIEHNFLGDMLDLANKLAAESIKIVDFRLLRHENPRCVLLLTGSELDLDKSQLITQNYMAQTGLNFKVHVVKDVNIKIKDLFSFEN